MITPERLLQFTFGFAPPLVIEAAMRHGVFELLDQGAKTIDDGMRGNTDVRARDARVAERARWPRAAPEERRRRL